MSKDMFKSAVVEYKMVLLTVLISYTGFLFNVMVFNINKSEALWEAGKGKTAD